MKSLNTLRWLGMVALIGFAGAALSTACKPKDTKDAAPAASASGAASVNPVMTGPCAPFLKAVCDTSGEHSQSCTSSIAVAELLSKAGCEALAHEASGVKAKLAEKRKACDKLVKDLCAGVGNETETCAMVKTQTKNFPPERCTQMLEHFPEVMDSLKKMEDAKKPLSPEKQAAMAGKDAPSYGPADAKVTVVEFSDFQCPYCSRAADTLTKLKTKYGTKVRFVFRQFPLSFHQNANLAAQASLAANAQGKFWAMHDVMFKNQKALEADKLAEYAKEAGLDVAKFKKALDDKTFAAPVEADTKLGSEVGVSGTPSLFLNGKKIENAIDVDAVSALIDKALAN